MNVKTKVEFVEQSKLVTASVKVEIDDEKEQSDMARELASRLWEEAHVLAQRYTLQYKR